MIQRLVSLWGVSSTKMPCRFLSLNNVICFAVIKQDKIIYYRSEPVMKCFNKLLPVSVGTHWAHDVVATLNQRQWRWFNVATTSCDAVGTMPELLCARQLQINISIFWMTSLGTVDVIPLWCWLLFPGFRFLSRTCMGLCGPVLTKLRASIKAAEPALNQCRVCCLLDHTIWLPVPQRGNERKFPLKRVIQVLHVSRYWLWWLNDESHSSVGVLCYAVANNSNCWLEK